MAVSLMIYATEQSWERFNIMFAVNGLIVAALGLTLPQTNPATVISLALAAVGLLLSAAWFLLVKRTHEFADYYTLAARELEEKYLRPEITTLSLGGKLSDGKKVQLDLLDGKKTLQLGGFARMRKAKFISYFVIVVFGVFYALVLCLGINGLA